MSRAPALIEDATRHDLRPYEAAFILGLSVRQLGHRLTRGDIAFGYAGRLRRIPIAVVRELKQHSPLAQLAIDAIAQGTVEAPKPMSSTARPVALEQWAGALCSARPASTARATVHVSRGSRNGAFR